MVRVLAAAPVDQRDPTWEKKMDSQNFSDLHIPQKQNKKIHKIGENVHKPYIWRNLNLELSSSKPGKGFGEKQRDRDRKRERQGERG